MAGNGIDGIPIRWPAKYDAAFFDELFRETLALGDVRNAVGGTGVTVTGTSSEEATISASPDVLALLTAPFVTVSADAALQNERVLTAGAGITLLDGGPGGTLTIVAQGSSWGNLIGVPIYTEAPTPPVWEYTVNDVAVGSVGFAYANDDLATGSLAGDLVLAPVAGRVFAASPLALDTDASLLLGGSAGTDGQSIVLSEGAAVSPSWLTAGTDDRVLRQTGGALNFGQLTVGMAPDAVWTFAKLQNFDALSVLGRSANSSGVGDEIAAAAGGDILNRNGTSLVFGQALTGTYVFSGATTDFRGIVYINPDPQTVPAAAIPPDSRLIVVDNSPSAITYIQAQNNTGAGTGVSLGTRHIGAAGTFASPLAINTTDVSYIGFIGGAGYDGTSWITGSRGLVGIRPAATWSNTSHPTRVTIETTPVASTTRAAVAQFDQAEIDLAATLFDFNGTLDVDGGNHDISTTGTLTLSGTGETLATFVDDGACTLYFNNVATLATTATGVSVVGNIETAGTISITGTGETLATFVDDGAVTLFHNNTARIATSANGVDVTGILTATAQVRTGVYTVGTLPAGTQGDRALVTDALTPVFGAAVAAGGAAIVPVYYTGAAWFVG